MSSNDEESSVQELVIIRRRGGDEEGAHKGGVWKIAYADFMTAMMAFFLVMWLINATDKKVLTQLATYFNPLRLTDKAPTTRGPHEPHSNAGEDTDTPSKQPDAKTKAKLSPAGQKMLEEALFSDPYGMLDKLAKEAASTPVEPRPAAALSLQGQQGRVTGEAFRDPFDPAVQAKIAERAKSNAGDQAKPSAADPPKNSLPADQGKDAAKTAANDSAGSSQKQSLDAAASNKESLANREKEAAEHAEMAKLESEIKQAVAQLGSGALPEIEVKVTEDGLLISLTDKFDFGMFAIASAEPRPVMILIMEKLAKALQTRTGQLVVRGHTDGRPFRSATYDNWRLSTARAHMAYYMLVRGGIEEKRFDRIEGHADRTLRVPSDSGAAQNRRIEILLRAPKP